MAYWRNAALLLVTALALILGIGACTHSDGPDLTPDEQTPWSAGAMVSAANPHAVDAAMRILERGGHAVDAAIAAHAVLGMVEPQSSGLGGGAFMLVYQRDGDTLAFYDGREVAPAGARIDMFMRDGEAIPFLEAWQSGTAVGVPGAVALYAEAHRQYGNIPWNELFAPAIALATEGFAVSPRLASLLPRIAELGRLDENPGAAEYYYPDGKPLQPGHTLRNPDYARTLSRIATEGSVAFYSGEIAEAIVRAARAEPNPGTLSLDDLAGYRVARRDAVCGPFRDLRVCSTTPPSSGAAQIMMMLMYDDLLGDATSEEEQLLAFVDAQRLAYADRDYYFGDPDAVSIPLEELLNPVYLRYRASHRFLPDEEPVHGRPGAVLSRKEAGVQWGADTTEEVPGTTHLSIIDSRGNAVSMTATVEAPFGSGRWAAGFLLNNEMTDFAREVTPAQAPPANAIAPGRRPRSSMSPVMVFDAAGNIRMITGSPGGNSIPAYVYKSLIGVLDWGLDVQAAVDFPNIVARGKAVRVEVADQRGQEIADMLKRRGYTVQERKGENSGLHAIVVEGMRLKGAADSRREGAVGYLPPGS